MAISRTRFPFRQLRAVFRGGATRARRAFPGGAERESVVDPSNATGLLQESFVRRLERLNLRTRGLVSQGLAGEHRSRRHAGSAEFADYRRYVPGDDFRRIDWNAYARLGGLFVKQTEAKVEVPVHLLLDCSESMNWGAPSKLGFARQLAAAIGYLALARFDAVSAVCFDEAPRDRFALVRGHAQALRLLSFLEHAPVGTRSRIEHSIAQYCEGASRGGIAFLISDLLSDDDWHGGVLRLLRHGMDVVVIQVLAPQELRPTLDGEVELVDAETGDVVELIIGDEARHTYERRAQEWCDEVEAYCSRSEVGYLCLETTTQLEDIFLNRMRRQRIVR
jgi:uncharacterized protein (DUF58 family)